MKHGYIVKQDGQYYRSGENVPDMGSIVCVSTNGNVRNYEGLLKDVDKLPHYVGTGSSFMATDTAEIYKYEKTTDKWNKW